MTSSSRLLQRLYNELRDHRRLLSVPAKEMYGQSVIVPGENTAPAPGWMLADMRGISISEKAIESLFSIYGDVSHVFTYINGNTWLIKRDSDEQANAALDARQRKRLKVGDNLVDCYKLSRPPELDANGKIVL